MKTSTAFQSLLATLFLATVAAGCKTPPEVRELAQKTSANSSTLATHIQKYQEGRTRVANSRIERIKRIEELTQDSASRMDPSVVGMRLAGETDKLDLYQKIIEASDADAAAWRAQDEAQAQRKTEILAGIQEAETSPASLREVSKALASLVKAESDAARFARFASYVQSVASKFDELVNETTPELTEETEQ